MPAGRRTLLGIASLAVHAGVLATLAALPSPVRVTTSDAGDPIVVVEWSGDGTTPAASVAAHARSDAEPASATTVPVTSAPTAAAPAPTSARAQSTTRRRAASTTPTAASAETPAPAEPSAAAETSASATAGDRASPHALALQGLRDHTRTGTHVPSPRASAGIAPARGGEHTVPLPEHSPDGPVDDRAIPRSLADAGFFRNKKGDYIFRAPGGQYTAILLPDGRIGFEDHLVTASKNDGWAPRMAGIPELIRKAQKRELWAHDKAKLARRTFDLRLAIAVAFAETQVDRRLKALYRDLLEIWGNSGTPAPARRLTLFERWDECDEKMRVKLPGFEDAVDTRIDALRKHAGERARDKITGFIRKQLPKGSTDAYPDEELEQLNRRRHSKARFAPYDAPADEPPATE